MRGSECSEIRRANFHERHTKWFNDGRPFETAARRGYAVSGYIQFHLAAQHFQVSGEDMLRCAHLHPGIVHAAMLAVEAGNLQAGTLPTPSIFS